MNEKLFIVLASTIVAVYTKGHDVTVQLDTKTTLNVIGLEHPFVCVNFDWWPDLKCDYGNCSWVDNGINNLNFDSEILLQAAGALATPALNNGAHFGLLRVGGSLQDHVHYDFTASTEHCDHDYPMKLDPSDHLGFDQGCVTTQKRDSIRAFAKATGMKVIFGLNGLVGRTKNEPYWNYTGDWDATQAQKLLIEWGNGLFAVELGNEIAGRHGVTAHLEAAQYARDFAHLIRMRDGLNLNGKPLVFGVDNSPDIKWMDQFLGNLTKVSNGSIDAFTWHSYPLGAGAMDKVDSEIMDPTFCTKVIKVATELQQWSADKSFPLWMGETGGAYNSGRNTVTNRFMSAFWYLDWMGILSAHGHKAFCRQTLLGGNYGLLQNTNGTIEVNPDFWGAKLFTDLMRGNIVKGRTHKCIMSVICVFVSHQ